MSCSCKKTSGDASGGSANPVSILLVDDDPDCRMLIRDAIGQSFNEFDIHEATNGHEALTFLRSKDAPRPGVIFMDIEMPGVDGQAALRQIKADPRLRDIPVVMMTGLGDDTQMRLAAVNGANAYTLKPATAEAFFRTVQESARYWLTVHQQPERHHGLQKA